MTIERFFDLFLLAGLACICCLGAGRAIVMYACGVRVVVVDRQRTLVQVSVDSLTAVVLLFWWYTLVAYTLPLPAGFVPPWLSAVLVDALALKVAGAVVVTVSVVIYGLGVWTMGRSWRLGLDRDNPAPLVTHGVFAWTRNPIYVAFDLLSLATFLIQGRLIFAVVTALFVGLIHVQVRREEHFLAEAFGESYYDYCSSVGRYVSWSRPDPGVAST